MSKEQKQLLYEIATWHNKQFYIAMKDEWDNSDYAFDRECTANIRNLESEYTEKYGALPEWKYIDDIWATIKTLKEELGL